MESKLTPELSQALDRAIDAAASDPLVEAIGALRDVMGWYDYSEIAQCMKEMGEQAEYHRTIRRARAVLSKYRPVSNSDTLKS